MLAPVLRLETRDDEMRVLAVVLWVYSLSLWVKSYIFQHKEPPPCLNENRLLIMEFQRQAKGWEGERRVNGYKKISANFQTGMIQVPHERSDLFPAVQPKLILRMGLSKSLDPKSSQVVRIRESALVVEAAAPSSPVCSPLVCLGCSSVSTDSLLCFAKAWGTFNKSHFIRNIFLLCKALGYSYLSKEVFRKRKKKKKKVVCDVNGME